MSRRSTRTRLLLGLLCLCGMLPQAVLAQSCTTTSSPSINFGNVDVLSGTDPPEVSSSIAVQCSTGLLSGTVNFKVCLSIGGASGTNPRVMNNGTALLSYNLYTDQPHSNIWGSIFSGNPTGLNNIALTVNGGLLGGNASTTVPIYGYLSVSQNTTAPAGTYQQNLTGGQVAVSYTYSSGTPASCTAGGSTVSGTFGFTPTATVINSCYLSTTPVNFGSATSLGSALTASGGINIACTMSDSYTIKLNAGSTSGASLTDRRMQGPGSNVAHYQLYTSGSHASIWGDGTAGTSTVTGTGNATQQSYTVYGQVQSQATPAPGSYSDTITVTVTY